MNHLVSVIIPLYNAVSFFEETLQSVLQQSYNNIEVIVVDDGSIDGSFELAKTFESDIIKVVKNKGEGACAARNYGYELSSGVYIQYLDADDLLSEHKIATQIEVLKNQEKVIASGVWGRFYDNANDVIWEQQNINKSYDTPYNWLKDSWKGKGMGQTSIWLTPRKLIEQAGLWNEHLRINQDGEFFCRVLLQAEKILYCEDAKVFYRSGNPLSISQEQKQSRLKAESLLYSYQLYKEHVTSFGVREVLRAGLAHNFLMFIYLFYNSYNDLAKAAESDFYSLGYSRLWPVGGKRFKQLAAIIGFKTALRLKRYL